MRQIDKNASPMSNEARNSYVISQLTNTLIELLKTRDLNKISISELCEKAGVGRASFYRNFETKEDVLRRAIRDRLERLNLNQSPKADADNNDNNEDEEDKNENGDRDENENKYPTALPDLMQNTFALFEQDRDFWQLIDRRGLTILIKDVILDLWDLNPDDEAATAYSKAFVTYAFYGWIELWLQRGMKESPDEIRALFLSSLLTKENGKNGNGNG